MDFEIATALAPPTDDRIQWFETTYRIKLPNDFIAALKVGNGAVPNPRKFLQGKQERMIERMLCLLSNPRDDDLNGWYDFNVVLTQLDGRIIDDENLIGMNVIPFAVLFAGDFVCLDFRRTPECPSVAVWDHERSEELMPFFDTIAPSFSAFVDILY
jgi:hypothetical protein